MKKKYNNHTTLPKMNQPKSSEVDKLKTENDRSDVIKDIVKTFKQNKVYEKFKGLLDDLSCFDFGKSWVNSPAAFGDTHKYTIGYTIGDFQFKYCHILPEGEISSAKWSITYKTKEDELFTYSYMESMRARFFKTTKLPTSPPTVYPLNTVIFDEFKSKYVLPEEDSYYLFFGILNAFTNGHCMSIRSVDGSETSIYHQQLCDMIDI